MNFPIVKNFEEGLTVIMTTSWGKPPFTAMTKMERARVTIVKSNCKIRTVMNPGGRAVRCVLEVAIIA